MKPHRLKTTAVANRNADLALALEHHRAGRFDEAAHIYRRLCAADRGDSDVLFLMGVLCCDLGAFEPACRFLKEALAIAPKFPEATGQLAIALNGLGDLKASAGEYAEAQQLFERALKLVPGDARTLRSLGRVALLEQDFARAEVFLQSSLMRDGGHPEALNWLGLAQLQLKKHAAAERALRQSLEIRPDLSQARNNLGLALHWQERFLEAQACFEQVLARDPSYDKARINLANTLRILGKHDAARSELEAVLQARPDAADALNNLGAVFQDMGQTDLAMTTLTRALELAPSVPEIRWNLSLTQLQLGDFENGWRNFESRWDGCGHLNGVYQMPRERAWHGESLAGKRLLLWAEQGFGDTIQFIRFAQDVALKGATVYVIAPPELADIVRSAPGVSTVLMPGGSLPAYDFHCPLMSLPHYLGLQLNARDLHGATPYLSVAKHRIDAWHTRLAAYPGLKVGIAWAGRARPHNAELMVVDRRRNVPFDQLSPLFEVEGCSFFSLQKGYTGTLPPVLQDFSSEWNDFSDTAAFVANLDLVITVDTAMVHLAGAVGKAVWLLNRYDSCWRWLGQRIDSPWYVGLRHFRQMSAGDWAPVVGSAAAALAELATSRGCP
jgi:tetratricopeptide (TPR) repeat protein